MKICPRLRKYYINDRDASLKKYDKNDWQMIRDWMISICVDCPLDVCIYDRPGRLIGFDRERLEQSVVGCPKCQIDPVKREQIKQGELKSGLTQCEDGWECLYCGFIVKNYKPKRRRSSKIR